MDKILDEIRAERKYQVNKWGTEADVTVNNPAAWAMYIANHSTRWFDGGFEPYSKETVDTYRKQMIKVATLAVAAVEALDKQRDTNGRAFFEAPRAQAA